jgi:Fe2+ or Zn2+ uptake regulation protein
LFKIYIQNVLENWQKKCARTGLVIQDTTVYSTLFADEEDKIINKWAQENVDTLYSMLNNNHNCDVISGFTFVTNLFVLFVFVHVAYT